MSENYFAISKIYDGINSGVDFCAYADFFARQIKEFSDIPVSLVLDLACGSGTMTAELARRGYDMTGVDISPEMLGIARDKAEKLGIDGILLLCQDMRSFELYGTVDAVVSTLDGINHLTKTGDIKKCFSLVHNYLAPGGIFLFDINTPYKFESVYANRDFVIEQDGYYVGWQNYYNPKTKICDFDISVFAPEKQAYKRYDEYFSERAYSIKTMKRLLCECGFEVLDVCADFHGAELCENSERAFITSKRI